MIAVNMVALIKRWFELVSLSVSKKRAKQKVVSCDLVTDVLSCVR